jgi:hypothetical protein
MDNIPNLLEYDFRAAWCRRWMGVIVAGPMCGVSSAGLYVIPNVFSSGARWLVGCNAKPELTYFATHLPNAPRQIGLAADRMIAWTPIEWVSDLPIGRGRKHRPALVSSREVAWLSRRPDRFSSDRSFIVNVPSCRSTGARTAPAGVVGNILFVVDAECTERDEIEASLGLVQACLCEALVLNKPANSARDKSVVAAFRHIA